MQILQSSFNASRVHIHITLDTMVPNDSCLSIAQVIRVSL
jgi:hypothetical protein